MPHLDDGAGVRLARARGASTRARQIRDVEAEERSGTLAQRRLDLARAQITSNLQIIQDFRQKINRIKESQAGTDVTATGVALIGMMLGLGTGTSLQLGSTVATLTSPEGTGPSEEFELVGQVVGAIGSRGQALGQESKRRREQEKRSRLLEIELAQPDFSREAREAGRF